MSIINYQSPGQYLLGFVVFAIIVLAVLHGIFGGALGIVLFGVVCIMWIRALVSRKFFAKFVWSIILLFSTFALWTSYGCLGNQKYCAQLEADRQAEDKKAAVERAQRDMERCAGQFDWDSDPTCRIYSLSEITEAKARIAAREAAAATEERARLDREEQQRMDEAIKNRDLARGSAGQK